MKRILVFNRTDWLQPHADANAQYVHEVFSRIAAAGNYVALVSHRPLPFVSSGNRKRMEQVEGIQIARLGMPFFYRQMAGLFLSRLDKADSGKKPSFDFIVDCVKGVPLPIADYTDIPLIPIIFSLRKSMKASGDISGPIIAASEAARTQLQSSGVSDKYIIRAPSGEDPDSWNATAGLVLATFENMQDYLIREKKLAEQ